MSVSSSNVVPPADPMARVYVGIGSNIDREAMTRSSVKRLRDCFGELTLSPVYESEAVGFEGENFYNLVAAFDTDLSVYDVDATLTMIENEHGRDQQQPRFTARTLDLDLLLYDDLIQHAQGINLPRADIEEYAFVLYPLADIASNTLHPELGKTFHEMKYEKRFASQNVWQVDIDLANS